MSAWETFGAGAGIVSLVWQIATQMFGDYNIRAMNRRLDQYSKTNEVLLERLFKLEDLLRSILLKAGTS